MTTEVDELEKEKQQRIEALAQGKHGLPAGFPVGALEFLQVFAFLEALFDDDAHLSAAKVVALKRQLEAIEEAEASVRKQVLLRIAQPS